MVLVNVCWTRCRGGLGGRNEWEEREGQIISNNSKKGEITAIRYICVCSSEEHRMVTSTKTNSKNFDNIQMYNTLRVYIMYVT